MTDWRRRAACSDADPDLFFTIGPGNADAKAICKKCPVWIPCLFDALRRDQAGMRAGMRAGTTRLERQRIRAWDRRMRTEASR